MATTTETAIELLRSQGMRMTPQRIAIVEEIMGTSGYVLPSAAIKRVKQRVPGVSASTVYRTLERLEELGALAHVHLEHGLGYHQVSSDTHAHLVCSACGREQEVSQAVLQQLERSVEGEHGFRPDFSHHPISGVCTSCLEAQRSSA
ncbi:MAG TPA: Fur family transcriptional regulator [Actinomycetes bacterium]|jgi:Fur family ferric uptake transcriptional regulator